MGSQAIKTLIAAAAMAAFSAGAMGQVRQLQLGNPMDANPGVNSGGTNAPIPGYVPINGNDVVTGNVGGLGYFHGNSVPSPFQFQGSLPSADLNNFARQSAAPAPNGAARPFYLPSASVSTGQGSLYSAPIGGGFDSRIVPSQSFSPIATPQQLGAARGAFVGQAYDRQPPQAVPLDASVQGGVLNNPLFMLRTTEELARQQEAEAKLKAATQPSVQMGPAIVPPASPDATVGSLNGDARINGQSPEVSAARGANAPRDARVGSVYAELEAELNKQEGAGTEKPGTNQLVASTDIDPLTGRPRLTAASAKTPAFVGATGTSTESLATATTQPQMPFHRSDISAKPLEDASSARLTAGSNVKPLQIAPAAAPGLVPSSFDLLMVRAQQQMKDGKYADAQLAFQTALATKPDDPLALVGLAHAELAAGAYASAAYDLKFVFTRKPEMASVRYKADSFIPAARQDYLVDDLLKETAGKQSADMASFLYCYLCYQTGRTEALKAELKNWNDRPGHDAWAGVAKRAWGK